MLRLETRAFWISGLWRCVTQGYAWSSLLKNIYLSHYFQPSVLEVRALGKVLKSCLVFSLLTISHPDSQGKFQVLPLFSGHHIGLEVHQHGVFTLICKFLWNISVSSTLRNCLLLRPTYTFFVTCICICLLRAVNSLKRRQGSFCLVKSDVRDWT